MKTLVKLFVLLYCLIFQFTNAQNTQRLDSLLKVINNEVSHDTTKIKAYNDISFEYASSNPSIAKKYIYKAIALADSINRPRGKAGAYNCLGIIYYYQKEYDSAQINFKKALAINVEQNHLWGQASAHNQIGVINMLQAKYDKAIESYINAKTVFEKMKDTISMASTIGNIGMVYTRMGYYQKANDYHFEALQLNEKLSDEKGIRIGYIRIAMVYNSQKKHKNALEYYKKALLMAQKDNNLYQMASILEDVGDIYIELKKHALALENFNKAMEYRNLLSTQKGIGRVKLGIGKTYFATKDYSKALESFKEALNIFELEGDKYSKAITHNYISKCYLALHSIYLAKHHAKSSLEITQNIANIEGQKEAHLTLSEIAEKSGKTKQAFNLYKKFIILKDSIYTQEKDQHINELLTIYETEKKEQQIVLQENEIQLLEQNAKINNLQRILLGTGLGLSIVIFGLGFYALKQKIKKNKLEKEKVDTELEFKRKELTTHALHLAKKNEVLESLKQKAEELKSEETSKNGYNQLIRTINFDLQDDNNWGNFSKYFEEVHKDFNSKVKQKFPNVTPNELRLLALLKMNLSSKEIANILNISPDGIKKARYRLRKKLNITTEESLQDQVLAL